MSGNSLCEPRTPPPGFETFGLQGSVNQIPQFFLLSRRSTWVFPGRSITAIKTTSDEQKESVSIPLNGIDHTAAWHFDVKKPPSASISGERSDEEWNSKGLRRLIIDHFERILTLVID